MRPWLSVLKLLRPHQWIKNSFVLVGFMFSHRWHDITLFYQVSLATVAFCCMSSAVYIYNDIQDYRDDQQHPHKKHRPLASGKLTFNTAILLLIILALFATGLSAASTLWVSALIWGYFGLNILYTHYLKHIVILDVFAIATGFMLRILAGTWAVGIPPSQWLMFCGGMLTLLLGFCKRRAENQPTYTQSRAVLKDYSLPFLDQLIMITASCCILSYGLYAMSPTTIQFHHTFSLIYTIPLVIYGIFRYLYCLYRAQPAAAEDAAKAIWQDKHLLITLGLWFIFTLYLIA